MACIFKSYTNYSRFQRNKKRAIKYGTFENCYQFVRDGIVYHCLVEVMV